MTFRITLNLLLSVTVFLNGENGVECDHRESLMARNGEIADTGSIFSHNLESFSRTRPEGKRLYFTRSGPEGEYKSSLSDAVDEVINVNNEYETVPDEIQLSTSTRSGPESTYNIEPKPNNDEYNNDNDFISQSPEPQYNKYNNPNYPVQQPEAYSNNNMNNIQTRPNNFQTRPSNFQTRPNNVQTRPDGVYNQNNNLKPQPDYNPYNIYPPSNSQDFFMNLGRTEPGNYVTKIKYTRNDPDNNYNYKVVRSKTYQIYNPIRSRPNVGGPPQNNNYRTRPNGVRTVPGYHIRTVYQSSSNDGLNNIDSNPTPNYIYNNNNVPNNNMVRSKPNEPYSNIFSRSRPGQASNIHYGRPVSENPSVNGNIRYKPVDSSNDNKNFVKFVPAKSDFKMVRSGLEDLTFSNNNNIFRSSPDEPNNIQFGSDDEPKFRYIPNAPYIGNYVGPEDSYSQNINIANPVQDYPQVSNSFRSRSHHISNNNNFVRSTPDFSNSRSFLKSPPEAINDIFSRKHLRSRLNEELDDEFQLTKNIDDVFSNDNIPDNIKTDEDYDKDSYHENKLAPLRSDPYDYTTEYIDFIKSGGNRKNEPEYEDSNVNSNVVRSRPDDDYAAFLRPNNLIRSGQYDDYNNDNINVIPQRPEDYFFENPNVVRPTSYDIYPSNNNNYFRSRPDDFFSNDDMQVSKPYDIYNNDYNNFVRSKPDDSFDNYYVKGRPDDYNDEYNNPDRFSAVSSQGRFGLV